MSESEMLRAIIIHENKMSRIFPMWLKVRFFFFPVFCLIWFLPIFQHLSVNPSVYTGLIDTHWVNLFHPTVRSVLRAYMHALSN